MSPACIIDLTDETPPGRDHLTALPTEILQIILSYLYATHVPDRAWHELNGNQSSTTGPANPSPELFSVATTSKYLYREANNWAHHFLHTNRAITKYKDFKTPKAARQQRPLKTLMQWSSKNCVFCGKKTTRSAILMNGYRCCSKCDKEQWPDKITKSNAKTQFNLKDHQLLPSQSHLVLLAKHPGLPQVRYGQYFCAGVLTTMFLLSDVEALAALAHTDFKGHLAKREKDRQERKRKAEETAEKKAKKALIGSTTYTTTGAPITATDPSGTLLGAGSPAVSTAGLFNAYTITADGSTDQVDRGFEFWPFVELDEVIVIDD